MRDPEAEFIARVTIEPSIRRISEADWDALVGEDDPFVEHAFLLALEESGSVGPGSGWSPRHLLVRRGGRPIAATPLYEKEHSYGEYIFDFAWAGAAMRAGIPYYPKLVAMTPLTPATGRRLLRSPELDERAAAELLGPGLERARDELGASSVHALFLTEGERDALAERPGLIPRLTHQFRFENPGYGSFDELLASFRSSVRKQLRRERRAVAESGLRVEVVTGDALSLEHFDTMYSLYVDTCERKGSYPYLTRAFFEIAAARLRHRAVLITAREGDRIVAASLSFEKGANLYGRYWGSRRDYDGLHFELCYHRLVERAIERGLRRVEAGAQGSHKLKRGFLPVPIHSAHSFAHEGLALGVREYLREEAGETRALIAHLEERGPGRREPA